MFKSRMFRFLSALIFTLVGAVMVLVTGTDPTGVGLRLVSSLGFAFIISGISTIFRDAVVLKPETDETSDATAQKTYELLKTNPINPTGMRMVTTKRRGYDGYYSWLEVMAPQELFFAGRAVLHRIQNDLEARGVGSLEKILEKKLEQGTAITILFLDPRSDIIERLAQEEGQSKRQLLSDIAFSLGVTVRLYDLVRGRKWSAPTELNIRAYDEVPYFAFHKENKKAIVGFYYARIVGYTSAAFEILDEDTLKCFQSHFDAICDRAEKRKILEISNRQPEASFNEEYFMELYDFLTQSIGKAAVNRLIGNRASLTHRTNHKEVEKK